MQKAHELIHNGLMALNDCTKYGMKVDVQYCEKIHKKLQKRLTVLESKVKESKLGRHWQKVYPSINIRSDVQLSDFLFNRLKMPVINRTDKGNPSVDANTLEILSKKNPDVALINDYKRIYMADNTFIKSFIREQINGVIHPDYNLHNIKSYRSGSRNPNMQNPPKRDELQKNIVRKAIRPREGNQLIEADFGGIEVRVAACVTGDKKLEYDVLHGDMHGDMAQEIFLLDEFKKEGTEKKLRFAAKNGFVFSQFYGDYYGNNVPALLKLSDMPLQGSFQKSDGMKLMTGIHIGEHFINKRIRTVSEFMDHVEEIEYQFWNKRYKTYNAWKKEQISKYKRRGYLELVTGFVCSGVMSNNQITNYPMQGPAFHCLLKCFIEYWMKQKKEGLNSRQIGQTHDNMIIDADPNEKDYILEELGNIMKVWLPEQWDWITVPLEVEADIFPVNAHWASEPETITL